MLSKDNNNDDERKKNKSDGRRDVGKDDCEICTKLQHLRFHGEPKTILKVNFNTWHLKTCHAQLASQGSQWRGWMTLSFFVGLPPRPSFGRVVCLLLDKSKIIAIQKRGKRQKSSLFLLSTTQKKTEKRDRERLANREDSWRKRTYSEATTPFQELYQPQALQYRVLIS